MKKNTVHLELTEHQIRELQPLFKQVTDAFVKGLEHRGVVLGQFVETTGIATVAFMPADQACRIGTICEEVYNE